MVFNIKKYFNKIEFVAPNTNFYFDKDNPLSRSKDANMSHAIISSNKILKEDIEDKRILININDLFLSETLRRVKPPRYPGSSSTRFTLGSFDKGKSKVKEINNYPRNTNLKTEYVYKNPAVLNSKKTGGFRGRAPEFFIDCVPVNNYNIKNLKVLLLMIIHFWYGVYLIYTKQPIKANILEKLLSYLT